MVSDTTAVDTAQRADLQRQVDAVDWFHSYEIVPGVFSRGKGDMAARREHFAIPTDLHGKRVLDIGTADGYFAFLAEERGAEVLAIDTWPREGFFVAHRLRQSQVEFRQMSLYDLDPAEVGMFDVVFCFGVFYHLKKPVSAMERIARVAKDVVLLESEVIPLDDDNEFNMAVFHEGDEWVNDPTNWWVPTTTNFLATVRAAGFPRAELVGHYDYSRAVIRAEKGPHTQGKVCDEDIFIAIDSPVRGQSVMPGAPVSIRGWTVSQLRPETNAAGVYVYLDKLDVPAAELGQADYPLTRSDIAEAYGERYTTSGYELTWTPPATLSGAHTLHILVDTPTGWNVRSVPVLVGETPHAAQVAAGANGTLDDAISLSPTVDTARDYMNKLMHRNAYLERRVRDYESGRVFRAAAALLRLLGRPLP